jgi:hypothetical protein|tara:strand:+ start:166 stop:1233 length:1068 start_codon:yes stop_codon:yes gene_type:complete
MAILDKSSNYFKTVLYSGNGGTQNITSLDFQPDLVWLKKRNGGTYHNLANSISGTGKVLYPNGNNAEASKTTIVTAFNSNGFSLGTEGDINGSGGTFVSWSWKAGGSASSNSNGSITTSISANQDSGFSMVSYTGNNSNGATIGHGLGAAPKMVIIKKKSDTAQWAVGGTNIDSTFNGYMFLDSSGSIATSDNVFNDTAPSSSVVTLGTTGDSNSNGQTYIAFCFAEKQQFSKMGSYVGNGNSSTPTFVYTGFKPSLVITKPSSASDGWTLSDIPRDNDVGGDGNGTGARLKANTTDSESTNTSWAAIHKYSNGFSPQGTDNVTNSSGVTYIYMAFAENPLVTSTDNGSIPSPAR